jgi:hypothetical protein
MAQAPFATQPQQTGAAIAYRNTREGFIADAVAPIEPVPAELFEWDEHTIDELYTTVDDRVGRLSQPNQVTWSSVRREGRTEDHALDVPVPQKDIDNARDQKSPIDPLTWAVEVGMELSMLNREKRVASLACDLKTVPAAQRDTLSGTDQWNDANNTNVIDKIMEMLDAPLLRPNIAVLGQQTWTGLRTNPVIVEAVVGTGASKGTASRQAVAELFELDEIIVGRSWANTANAGQTASYARLWGKHAAFLHRNPLARTQGIMPTFMITARYGTPFSGTIEDPDMGAKGGVRVRTGECVKELVISNLCGSFLQNAVA